MKRKNPFDDITTHAHWPQNEIPNSPSLKRTWYIDKKAMCKFHYFLPCKVIWSKGSPSPPELWHTPEWWQSRSWHWHCRSRSTGAKGWEPALSTPPACIPPQSCYECLKETHMPSNTTSLFEICIQHFIRGGVANFIIQLWFTLPKHQHQEQILFLTNAKIYSYVFLCTHIF